VLESCKLLGVPDVFHIHDWQAAPIAIYLRTVYASDPALKSAAVATVLTIHNAGYQGSFPPTTTEQLLLPWDIFTMDKVEQFDHFNFLKGGLVYSDILTTVSKKYAEEIQTPEFGEQLDSCAARPVQPTLRGILNGVDYDKWDPSTDGNLAAHYSAARSRPESFRCREDLLHAFGLEKIEDTSPVIGIVSRFATQKGFDLVQQIAGQLSDRDV
jgi:starch synthase